MNSDAKEKGNGHCSFGRGASETDNSVRPDAGGSKQNEGEGEVGTGYGTDSVGSSLSSTTSSQRSNGTIRNQQWPVSCRVLGSMT